MIERIRNWWRRLWDIDRASLPYDWWERDRDLRHNGGHVRVVRHD